MRNFRRLGILAAVGLAVSGSALADPAVAGKEIIIGQTIALEGGRNLYGTAAAQGCKLYVDMINATGGVYGRKIVMRVLDDENNATKAEANARKLLGDGAFMLFGSIEGGPSVAVMKVASEAKVPFFGPMAGSPTLRRPHQAYVFPVRAEHRDEFEALMTWGKSTGLKSVGFLYSDSEVGLSHLSNVRLIADKLGMDLRLLLPLKGDIGDARIDEMVAQISESKPDMLLNHGSSSVYQRLIKRARQVGLKTQFMGVNSGSTQIAKGLGELAQGMVFSQVVPNPRERKHPISREYQDALQKAGGSQEYSYGALEGYMTAKALVMALRAAGPELTRSSLMRALGSARFDLGGISARYAPGDHEGVRFVDLSIVGRDGRFVH